MQVSKSYPIGTHEALPEFSLGDMELSASACGIRMSLARCMQCTQSGLALPKWDILVNAKSMDDVKKDFRTRIFTTMFQSHLPDPGKPPLFIDLLARQEGDQLIIYAKLMERFRNNFYLETMIPQYADNLKSLRGFKFDWTRNHANFDHVYANQAFTHKLNEFGIIHEAEEYNGAFGADWGVDGRFYTDALPFFQKHMVFC